VPRVLDVLVVGAGPVGLALAGDLAQRGRHVTILERGDGTIAQPRMDIVGVRTMEFARRWGIVPAVEATAYNRDLAQDNVYVTSVTGYELGRHRSPSMNASEPPAQSPQHRERCPQDMFDPVLHAWATGFPTVDLRYGHEFVRFEQTAERVLTTVRERSTARTFQIESAFLVGCDGAASAVAAALGVEFDGQPALTHTTNVIFRSAELKQLHDKDDAYRYIVVTPEGTYATLVHIDGWDRWRMSVVQTRPGGLTPAEVDAAIRRVAGCDFPFDVLSINNWTRRELVARRFGEGRVFIAGDAAHVMSPTGGFGMNTGIGDAVDLAWKLDAVLRGWGGPALLESYTAERRPVAARNCREASDNLARMLSPKPPPELCDDSAAGARARAEVGHAFAQAMSHEWATLGIHLGYRYDESPICVYDRTPPPPLEVAHYEQTSRAGARAPHVWLADGRSTLDLFGEGFVLLRLAAAVDAEPLAAALHRNGVPVSSVDLFEPAVREAYVTALVLVRPDGHVAWRGNDCAAAESIADCVRGATKGATIVG
jgi:2-polyprenyl-6-methoxyphenol hydroxylase-like FAD-dependent oxidoreductase